MATTFGQSLIFRLQDKELNFGARLPIARGPKTNVTTKAQGRADSYLIKPDGNNAVKWIGFSSVDMQAKQKNPPAHASWTEGENTQARGQSKTDSYWIKPDGNDAVK